MTSRKPYTNPACRELDLELEQQILEASSKDSEGSDFTIEPITDLWAVIAL